MRPRDLSVVVPYATLYPETHAALRADGVRARYVDVGDDEEAYWRLLRDLWATGRAFAIIEHDIVVRPGLLAEMAACPMDWCAAPYLMGAIAGTSLGCVRFGTAILNRFPDAVSRLPPERRSWMSLDSMVIGTLHRGGATEHVHEPRVRHLKYSDDGRLNPSIPARRNRMATRLLYVGGGGPYLNGVPARDFETDDPALIALCLDTGLYVRGDGPAPVVPGFPTPEPTPANAPESDPPDAAPES